MTTDHLELFHSLLASARALLEADTDYDSANPLLHLEHLDSQRERAALLAAAQEEADAAYQDVPEGLAAQYQDFLDSIGEDISLQDWKTALRLALEDDLTTHLQDTVAANWRERGLPTPTGPQLAKATRLVARQTLSATGDIRRRFLSPKGQQRDEYLARAAQTADSLAAHATDRLQRLFVKQAPEGSITRAVWNTSGDPDSRHADLDGVEADENGQWNWEGQLVDGPRPVSGSPADWSNCSCFVSYITDDGKER